MRSSKKNTNLRILVIGCTPLARKVIALIEKMATVVGVVNLYPDLGLKKANYDFLSEFSIRRPQDIHWTRDINGKKTLNWIANRRPDLIIQCGWSQIFKSALLRLPRYFCIGIHPAPLPKGRGAAVINWKIIEGGGKWGNSLFVMEEKPDIGDILDFELFVIEPRDNVQTVYLKVDRTALKMLRRTLPKIGKNTFSRIPQDEKKATRYCRRRPEDGLMDIRWNSKKILRYIRALAHPYPGAFFQTIYGQLIIWQGEAGAKDKKAIPGTILNIEPGHGLRLKTGVNGSIWLTQVTPPDDVECWVDDWALEKKIKAGEILIKTKE